MRMTKWFASFFSSIQTTVRYARTIGEEQAIHERPAEVLFGPKINHDRHR